MRIEEYQDQGTILINQQFYWLSLQIARLMTNVDEVFRRQRINHILDVDQMQKLGWIIVKKAIINYEACSLLKLLILNKFACWTCTVRAIAIQQAALSNPILFVRPHIFWKKYVLKSIRILKKDKSLMNSNFQQISDHSNEEQQSNRQEEQRDQSNQPSKTKQINKGRPKKRVQKQFLSNHQQGSQPAIRDDDKDQKQSIFNDVVLKVQRQFIDFFQAIKQRKGFIYCRQYRDKLKKCETLHIEWSQFQKWDPQRQMEKLNRILPPDEIQNQNLKRLMMEVSSLHASEFTEEVYDIFLRLYTILKDNYPKINRGQIEKLAVSISSNEDQRYILFSREFRKKVKPTKKFPYIPLKSNEPYKILLLKLADAIQQFLFD